MTTKTQVAKKKERTTKQQKEFERVIKETKDNANTRIKDVKNVAELAAELGIDISKVSGWDKGIGVIGSGGWSRNPIECQKQYIEKGIVSKEGQYSAKIFLSMEPSETYPCGVYEVEEILKGILWENCKGKIKFIYVRDVSPLTDEEDKYWAEYDNY